MPTKQGLPGPAARRLKWPLRLTHAGLFAERVGRAFWPLWSVLLVVLATLMLGWQDTLPLEAVWVCAVLAIVGAIAAFWIGARRFELPSRAEAIERLDETLPGRPIAAVSDVQAIGAGDAASEAVWNAHLERMAKRLDEAKAAKADLNLAPRDPFALRYVALLAFAVALIFGSVFRVATVTEIASGGGQALATGPAWEGWVEPPLYTGQPSLYLNDIDQASFEVPAGSQVTVRFYGELGALALHETVSERTEAIPPASDPVQSFDVMTDGVIRIEGAGGREWQIDAIEDMPPTVEFDGTIARGEGGTMEAPFIAADDHGVTSGRLEISLDLTQIERRFGLTIDPEERETIVLDLPMTISGDRTDFAETAIDDFSEHPWANLAVSAELFAFDAAGQEGLSAPQFATLPGRRFFDPLAKAIIEQRRDLLWNRANGPRVAQVLRAVSYTPDDIFRSEGVYLKLRYALRQLEAQFEAGLSDEIVTETAEVLWDIALEIEIGDLADAQERLRRAQDRLSEAIENGATDDEIAELMQELREAMQDYMQQLAEQNQGQEQQQAQGEMQEMSQQDLQDMLDRLQELMEQGRMAEAQQLMEQLRQMMENMQVTQGQQGQGQQSEGEQAMEGLAETLREQQGLSDEAFRDLQEQFAPEGQEGQSQNNTGRSGSQGSGQQHSPGGSGEPQQGDPQQGGGQQSQGQQQQQGGSEPGQGQEGALADRQQALRQELNRQMQNMPGAGTPEGDASRDALGRAGEAMDDAEEALREDDFAGALDSQSQAMEALREGMRDLADQMAQQQGQQGQQEGEQQGQNQSGGGTRDPLGRDLGENGRIGTDENLLQGEDVYRRARELLDEIRKRSGEQERPTEELDYLRRLLDRF
ncbi:MAG: TIGR02302 family protein [Paracoccaceae bacterium]